MYIDIQLIDIVFFCWFWENSLLSTYGYIWYKLHRNSPHFVSARGFCTRQCLTSGSKPHCFPGLPTTHVPRQGAFRRNATHARRVRWCIKCCRWEEPERSRYCGVWLKVTTVTTVTTVTKVTKVTRVRGWRTLEQNCGEEWKTSQRQGKNRQNASQPLVVRVASCMASRLLQGVHGPMVSSISKLGTRKPFHNVPQFIALNISQYPLIPSHTMMVLRISLKFSWFIYSDNATNGVQ